MDGKLALIRAKILAKLDVSSSFAAAGCTLARDPSRSAPLALAPLRGPASGRAPAGPSRLEPLLRRRHYTTRRRLSQNGYEAAFVAFSK